VIGNVKRKLFFKVVVSGLAALLLVLPAACDDARDTSTLGKALLGHWKNISPGTNADVYYSPNEATFDARGGGQLSTLSYKITEENQGESRLMVQYASSEEPLKITFSKDRNTITVYPTDMPELLQYRYVDSKQQP
jgi:hypothetical protein